MTISNEIISRNNVSIIGNGPKTLVLAHGFGCDQNMWQYLIPAFKQNYRLVLFDYVGSGQSDVSQFFKERYSSLEGYAKDVVEVLDALELQDTIFVGHSVSSIIGLLASIKRPELFSKLVMICPSPCFLNFPPDYMGGFEKEDLTELLNLMDKNYIGWAQYLAPLVMGAASSNHLIEQLADSFCSTDPHTAKTFAKATFFSDYRHILQSAKHPTLIFQSEVDSLASTDIGKYMHASIPNSDLLIIPAEGHCLHMTHPEQISTPLKSYAS